MAVINGTNSGETKYGTSAADTINGYAGIDLLYGRAGNDTIDGGLGADKIWGEDGNDILRGGTSQQLATVESDSIWGGNGNDIIYGNGGDDFLYGDAGTDTVKGEVGNDTIKGGTGIGFLYGGEGHDNLYYDPTTGNIGNVGQYLSGSIMDGGIHHDTLNLYNRSTYTSGATQKPTDTYIWYEGGVGHINFADVSGNASSVGTIRGVESIYVNPGISTGALRYTGDYYGAPETTLYVVGTNKADTFTSYYGGEIIRGGAGNDTFNVGSGISQIRSETNDADIIRFNGWAGITLVEGFNGGNAFGGDRMYFEDYHLTNPSEQVIYANNITTFKLSDGGQVQVVGVDLREAEGVDWFIV